MTGQTLPKELEGDLYITSIITKTSSFTLEVNSKAFSNNPLQLVLHTEQTGMINPNLVIPKDGTFSFPQISGQPENQSYFVSGIMKIK